LDEVTRYKLQITNPKKIDTANIICDILSKTSNYTYETKTDSSGAISTAKISINAPTISFLWGLSEFAAADYGCPIGIYLS